MGTLLSISPTTGAQVGCWPTHTSGEIEQAIDAAHDAFTTWRTSEWSRRSRLLLAVADELTVHREQLAALKHGEE